MFGYNFSHLKMRNCVSSQVAFEFFPSNVILTLSTGETNIPLLAGMEWSSQGIHGQMVLNTSLSAPSNQEGGSGRRWFFLQRKGPCGGMLIVTGQEPQFMVLSLSIQESIVPTLFPSLMQRSPSYSVYEKFLSIRPAF